ncbi:HPr family phosphocarrier protein [Maridesulfovibrio ferrireducens]|uniref:HPr family phosphocarrier protein n=1 Tax=Maridesulfovibrio ferrireducens TaxID=246191 RepID=UPI001A1D46E4|nr:HPr family phosphocarrier protein [Maridesulfovibrio ferrireducens]MBI9112056.1 HPr family phosphocarrier protein [Maridesulfovibrio ferrireducens]
MIENSALREGFPDSENAVARTVIVVNQLGLHARPAARLAQEAQNFQAEIAIICDSQEVDAKSILDILTLAAAQGSTLELRADGIDADAALDCLEEMFKSKFGEEK